MSYLHLVTKIGGKSVLFGAHAEMIFNCHGQTARGNRSVIADSTLMKSPV
jgi:hypothetical protein